LLEYLISATASSCPATRCWNDVWAPRPRLRAGGRRTGTRASPAGWLTTQRSTLSKHGSALAIVPPGRRGRRVSAPRSSSSARVSAPAALGSRWTSVAIYAAGPARADRAGPVLAVVGASFSVSWRRWGLVSHLLGRSQITAATARTWPPLEQRARSQEAPTAASCATDHELKNHCRRSRLPLPAGDT